MYKSSHFASNGLIRQCSASTIYFPEISITLDSIILQVEYGSLFIYLQDIDFVESALICGQSQHLSYSETLVKRNLFCHWLRDGLKTQLPVDRRLCSVPASFYRSKQ